MTTAVRTQAALVECRESIATHSKSFSMASKLLPADCRDDAAVVYAWCRRADDAIDDTPVQHQAAELTRLRRELGAIYDGATQNEPVLAAFAEVVARRQIPREYPAELLAGMAMDADDTAYPRLETLYLYCYRVASTVGLMMSHVIGLSRDSALTEAAQMGIAMQITNICRDVEEDWQRGRLYLPDEILAKHGAGDLRAHLGRPFPDAFAPAVAASVRDLLALADRFYRAGDRGLTALPFRAAFGVRTARLVYSAIGSEISRQHHDVRAGRAVVPRWRKLLLVGRAGVGSAFEVPGRWWRAVRRTGTHHIPNNLVEFSHDIVRI